MARLCDEIIDEIHAVRFAHASKFDFDIDLILQDLQKSELAHTAEGWPVENVTLPTPAFNIHQTGIAKSSQLA